jgi:hypothetical protein
LAACACQHQKSGDYFARKAKVAFPQMATGEDAGLERLRLLPGFEMRGMNSAENARFICWPTPAP